MKNVKNAFLMLVIICVVLVCGCSSVSYEKYESTYSDLQDAKSKLIAPTWAPKKIRGEQNCKVPPQAQTALGLVHIKFESANGALRADGMSGANLFSADVELSDDDKIAFKNLASTMKLGEYSDYEALFLKALIGAKYFEVDSYTLKLYGEIDGKKALLAEFYKSF